MHIESTTLLIVSPVDPRGRTTSADDELLDAMVQTSFATMAVLSRIGADNAMSLTQVRVMGILRDRRLRMTALAHHLGLDKSSMTGLVDRAESRGLLARGPHPTDGRVVDVFLTQAGIDLAERVTAQVKAALAELTSPLGRAEQARLGALLGRLLDRDEPT
jgi:DNA-binding MarR family transcriptional regulator